MADCSTFAELVHVGVHRPFKILLIGLEKKISAADLRLAFGVQQVWAESPRRDCLASLGVAGAHYAFWRVHERRFLMLMINWLLINNCVQATPVDMSMRFCDAGSWQLAAGMRVRNAGSCSWHAFFATLQLAAGMQF